MRIIFEEVKEIIKTRNMDVLKVLGVENGKSEQIGRYLVKFYQDNHDKIFKFDQDRLNFMVSLYKTSFGNLV